MIRIGLVDDHAIVRSALRQYFSEQVDLRVVGEARNADEAVTLANSTEMDVLMMDLSMPGQSPMEALAAIHQQLPRLQILVLSGYPEELYAPAALRAGASGYLNKECPLPQILDAVRRVAMGGRAISPGVAQTLAGRLNRSMDKQGHDLLSQRELQVFLRLAGGEKIGQIARDMAVSVKTVSTYRARVLTKLSLTSNPELTRYAVAYKLIE